MTNPNLLPKIVANSELHDFRPSPPSCKICRKCGTAEHKTTYGGFKFWLAGVGYHALPDCK